jgi:ribose transport system substrate-binding protein
MRKPFFQFMLVFILLAGIVACDRKTSSENIADKAPAPLPTVPAHTPNGKKITVGLVVAGYQAPYYVPLVEAARKEAEAEKIELFALDSAYDNKKEADNVRTLIGRKVDVAVISPIDRNAVIPSLRALREAGIPVIDLCNRQAPEGDQFVTVFLGVDPLEQGMRAGKALRKLLGDKGSVVLVEGFPGAPGQILRTEGFEKAIKGSQINIVGKNTGDWKRDKAMTVMEDFLTRFPKIDGVFTHDDSMAIGVIQAVKAAKRLGEFPIVSVGGNKDGMAAIRAGELTYTYFERPDWEGIHSVIVAAQVSQGKLEEWAKQFKDAQIVHENRLVWVKTPGADITKENVNQFRASW